MPSLSSLSRTLFSSSPLRPASLSNVSFNSGPLTIFTRNRSQLAPRQVKYIKRHKGVIPIPTGGSVKGTTLAFGEWGLRIKGNGVRFSAKQLTTAEDVIKRKLKVLKGAKVWLRVFPDIPVCIKGNETRMGKGKGTFEFWAARIPTGRVIFEIGGVPIREELARDILRQAAAKLPTKMEFISRTSPPRLGNLLLHPPKAANPASTEVSLEAMEASSLTAQPTTI
ncbi:ribosomal protein L16 [Dendrothele bispora CBS 962.96]|uniref:Ribosomal protein L16 n=1 Tax=Dendrothele bispora (strain CBS 962.96) TaxID=1314807 RepID=A0A4S8LKJ4_DENBC|nr:ribosomal protein L16 [Dendrothele bispora CBS 962.96]THU89551.1 ribosomal protein L16 [Dendrothele bispora CBS 962.96]